MIALTLALVLAANVPAAPTLRAASDTLRADEELHWNLSFQIHNPGGGGFYTDSLVVEIAPTRSDGSAAPRLRMPMPWLAKLIQPVSAGGTGLFQIAGEALAERGVMQVRLFGHEAGGRPRELGARVIVAGGGLFDLYPARVEVLDGQRVEWYLVPAREASVPSPGVILVPAAEGGARAAIRAADRLAGRGLTVLVVGLPGSGASSGPDDAGGPTTAAALAWARRALLESKLADPARLAIWGVREGADPALRFAAGQPELRGVIVESGSYDLWARYRRSSASTRAALVRGAGTDSTAWRERSSLVAGTPPRGSVLVLHAERDSINPAAGARALEGHLRAQGVDVTAHYAPDTDRLSTRDVARASAAFFARLFQP